MGVVDKRPSGRIIPSRILDLLRTSLVALAVCFSLFKMATDSGAVSRDVKPESGTVNEAEQQKSIYENPFFKRALAHFKESLLLSRQGDFSAAALAMELALKNFQECGDRMSIAATRLNLGMCYRFLRKDQFALNCFEGALEISRKEGFEHYEAKALQRIGYIYNHLGLYDNALAYLEEALALHARIQDKRGEALDWLIMGIAAQNRDTGMAGNCFSQALAMSRQIGDVMLESRARHLLNKGQKQGKGNSAASGGRYPLETL
jgi:tetratricopeptide (TPR) repeat protein